MINVKHDVAAIILLTLLQGARGDAPTPLPQSEPSRAPQDAVETWKDMRYGMFIHWGPVALTGYEIGWSRGGQTSVEEDDELAGWLSDDASSGVVFEKATSLTSNDWTIISPASTTMQDWWNVDKSYVSIFELVGETNGFIRLRQE